MVALPTASITRADRDCNREVRTSAGPKEQGLGTGELECNENVQVYRGEQQGWTGRKQGSARGEQARAEGKNDAPVILRGADWNRDLASADQIGNTFCRY